jgi:hypothetical protein
MRIIPLRPWIEFWLLDSCDKWYIHLLLLCMVVAGLYGIMWLFIAFSLRTCRQWAWQILIWEVLFTATDYVGLQIRHVKIITIMLFDKIYCISTFCRGYLISLASFSARLLWRLTQKLYKIMGEAIYDNFLTTTYACRSLLAFLYPDCSLLIHHCDKL